MNAPVAVGACVFAGLVCMAVGVVWLRKAFQQPVQPFDKKARR